jgi:enoyl-CoA hydratase/carnithine racemase
MTIIHYEVRDKIAEILFNNGPVNAITEALMDGLLDALQRAGKDNAVRAVIIGSAIPGRFCAGLDLGAFLRSPPSHVHSLVDKLYAQLCDVQFNLGKPSIAAITGAVRGGGMSVAISCDLIVASETSSFGYPELDVGLLPSLHYTHLPRIVGRYRAFDLLFTGRTFGAQEAQALGLVSRIAPEAEVLGEARKLAQVLAAKSPELMRLGKTAFTRAIDADYRQGVAGAVVLATMVTSTEDSKEGLSAFVEKRKPVWKKP